MFILVEGVYLVASVFPLFDPVINKWIYVISCVHGRPE